MTKDKKYIVGINRNGYPEKKNINYSPHGIVQYVMETDRYKFLDHLHFKLRRKINHKYHACFSGEFWHKSQLNHFFNSISVGSKPWVSTFEYEIPRHQRENGKLWHYLEKDSCKQLLAMSLNARNVQHHFLESHNLLSQVQDKISVLHPPQELIANISDYENTCTITFIGNAFYHKGGLEFLRACDYLWNERSIKFEINLVSNFSRTNWLDVDITKQDEAYAEQLIARNSSRISIYSNINSNEIKDILSKSHMSVLPSLGETYGYAVLESQAAGCPTITTNSWAFPEINNNHLGWVLDLPTITENGGLKADLSGNNGIKKYRNLLYESLVDRIAESVMSMDKIKFKASLCQDKIENEHSPKNHRVHLEKIYAKCLE